MLEGNQDVLHASRQTTKGSLGRKPSKSHCGRMKPIRECRVSLAIETVLELPQAGTSNTFLLFHLKLCSNS